MNTVIFLFVVIGTALGKNCYSENEADLTSAYGLVDHPYGHFKVATTYLPDYPAGSNPEVAAYLLVFGDGCGVWSSFENDRLYMWHQGKTYFDIIYTNGSLTTKCLGNTLRNEDCNYLVDVPRDAKVSFRPGRFAFFTGVVLGATAQASGTKLEYADIEAEYPQHYDVIKKSQECA